MKSSRRMTHRIKRGALAAACALALSGPALAADDELRVLAAVALHEFDTLVVFAQGPAGWEVDFGARMGTLAGMVDITGQCAVDEATGTLVQIRCDFDDGLPEDGDFLLELSSGYGQLGVPFSFAIGRQGDQGAQGIQGSVGPQGVAGVQGPQGIVGIDGEQGAQGDQGAQGPQGDRGDAGLQGITGPVGDQGPVGSTGAVGEQGAIGAAGPQGEIGQQGPQGPMGYAGPIGDTGAPGIVGEQGPVGAQGAVGPQGAVGEVGDVGTVGTTGPQGPQGMAGIAGPTGVVGDTGPMGPMGPMGSAGPTGPSGDTGPVGPQGLRGPGGAVSLVTSEPLASGSACAWGGQQIRAGLDINDNGILDPNEVQQTGVVCNDGVWTGERSFNTCGASGRFGPTDSSCATTYASTTLEGEVSVVAGIQEWTVPASGTYRITADGAQGGYIGGVVAAGGLGARVSADVELQGGEVIRILVGQSGFLGASQSEAGAGGGSFVSLGEVPLVVAGGGGSHGGCSANTGEFTLGRASTSSQDGSDGFGRDAATGGGAGGIAGNGGGAVTNPYPGGGGGGFTGTGGYGQRTGSGCHGLESGLTGIDADPSRTAGGQSFLDGGVGGRGCYQAVFGQGGFGGGGGAGGCGGAGGGGYSGGGGGGDDRAGGGGGGSFAAGANPVVEAGVNSGNGLVTIDRLP